MASQDDLGLLWYGVPGTPFTNADPAEVLLNSGNAPPPLLSDHPRPLLAQHPHLSTPPHIHTLNTPPPPQGGHLPNVVTSTSHHFLQQSITTPSYADPTPLLQTHHTQMLYDASTGDYITPPDYMYETLENYDDDSSGGQSMLPQGQHDPHTPSEHACHQPGYQDQEDCDPQPAPKTKKPKVHHHPALKLKTPIAYQKDTDLSAIPIMREGMAVCEKCGAIGVKHAFYGKERKFCSLSCARPSLQPSSYSAAVTKQDTDPCAADLENDHMDCDELPQSGVLNGCDSPYSGALNGCDSPCSGDQDTNSSTGAPLLEPYDSHGSYDWTHTYLKKPDFRAVPVKCFPHAPMSECWDQMGVGMKVEVACGAEGVTKDAYWVATVIGIAGYKACLRFEGFVEDNCCDFWVDLCSEEVHPVGWCASQGKALIPPRSIQDKYSDWKQFLMKRLTGARTLPSNFHSKVLDSHKSRFRAGLNVEVVDKNRIAQMRVATVTEVVGKRLHLRYHGAPLHDNGFWCHEDAPIIHPVGWSREVGHEIVASQQYHDRCRSANYDPDDASPPLFVQPPTPAFVRHNGASALAFTEAMKLEAIDPLNLATICVATVMKVLRNNYLMIRIDSYENDDTGSDWFCYHATSPCIFPAGFCGINHIPLTPPKGYEGEFTWFNYLNATTTTAAPPALFNRDVGRCGFEAGMSLEAADLMDPRLVCVATVRAVHGRLLQVHFDGWDDDFDQWIDAHSSDIYPVGWCQMVGYKLEGPRPAAGVVVPSHRRKIKSRGGGRRRRGAPAAAAAASPAPTAALFSHTAPTTTTNTGRRGRPPKNSEGLDRNNGGVQSPADGDRWAGGQGAPTRGGARGGGRGGRGRRGRPPKRAAPPASSANAPQHRTPVGDLSSAAELPLLPSNAAHLTPAELVAFSYHSHNSAADEQDNSDDDTSSGVASLADSDNCSMEGWGGEELDGGSREGVYDPAPSFAGPPTPSLNTPTPSLLELQATATDPSQAEGEYGGEQQSSDGLEVNKPPTHGLGGCNSLQDEPSLDLFSSDTFPTSNFEDSINSFNASLSSEPLPAVRRGGVSLAHPAPSNPSQQWAGDMTAVALPNPNLVVTSQPGGLLPCPPLTGLTYVNGTTTTLFGATVDTTATLLANNTFTTASLAPLVNNNPTVLTNGISPVGISSGSCNNVNNNSSSITTCSSNNFLAGSSSFIPTLSSTNIINSSSSTSNCSGNNSIVSATTASIVQQQQLQQSQVLIQQVPLQQLQQQLSHQQQLRQPPQQSQQQQQLGEQSHELQQQQHQLQEQSQPPLFIPRLVDAPPLKDGSKVQPKRWTAQHVAAFLEKNDCAAYSANFLFEGIDGPALLALNQQPSRVMALAGMKVGPSLKVQDLVKQLVALVSPAQARYQATLAKRGMTFSSRQ